MTEKDTQELPQPGDEDIPGEEREEDREADGDPTEGPGGVSVDEPTEPALNPEEGEEQADPE